MKYSCNSRNPGGASLGQGMSGKRGSSPTGWRTSGPSRTRLPSAPRTCTPLQKRQIHVSTSGPTEGSAWMNRRMPWGWNTSRRPGSVVRSCSLSTGAVDTDWSSVVSSACSGSTSTSAVVRKTHRVPSTGTVASSAPAGTFARALSARSAGDSSTMEHAGSVRR